MNNYKTRLKVKSFNNSTPAKDTANGHIQPFKQMPSGNNTGQESVDRINAHDLFSHYTAEIIKEDVIFIR